MIPTAPNYWLKNARVPTSLLESELPGGPIANQTRDGVSLVDIEIVEGAIAQIISAAIGEPAERPYNRADVPVVDLKGGQVWPCFVDIHTHLDKGHIWERSPNPDGTFASAIEAVRIDAEKYWKAEDVYRRMEFGLKCSYAHGTQAIRTHIDAQSQRTAKSFEVFKALQNEWSDRLSLQFVSLVSLDYFQEKSGEELANRMAEIGGILGGVAFMNPDLEQQLDRVFTLATERGLNLDFHADENGNPDSSVLKKIAETALRHQFSGNIVCGHCCSLATQSPDVVAETLELVKQAKIGIVSLPMCNLYLQDRQLHRTPRWRGVTLLHELKQAGIPVTVASDNCRDPFHSFGDHDVLEVFKMSVHIAHLDQPYGDWPTIVAKTAADLMGLREVGRIQVGLPANLVLFTARTFSELLSRSQHNRRVLRTGKEIDSSLPDYGELDDLLLA
ncbi:MAG: cytosine deaminase [Actinomycetota bacterium]